MKQHEDWNAEPKLTFSEKVADFISRYARLIGLLMLPITVGSLLFYHYSGYYYDAVATAVVHGIVYLELLMIRYGYTPGKVPLLVPIVLYTLSVAYTAVVVVLTLLVEISALL